MNVTQTLQVDRHHRGTKSSGEAMVLPYWHVPRDFINSFIAPKQLVRSEPGRCHSTQFNDQNIAKSIALYSVPRATCHWHVARVLTLLILVLERLNGFGPGRFCSAWTDDSNVMWSIAICIVPKRQQYYVVDCNMYFA